MNDRIRNLGNLIKKAKEALATPEQLHSWQLDNAKTLISLLEPRLKYAKEEYSKEARIRALKIWERK